MPKRTTILLDEDVYKKLVEESLRRYGTTKALSEVVNQLIRKALRSESELLNLIFSDKIARTTSKEFEAFRRKLSERFEA
ncbi:MAG: hypothetical protein QXY55_06855 [Candidatus Korarchaeota archaeon]